MSKSIGRRFKRFVYIPFLIISLLSSLLTNFSPSIAFAKLDEQVQTEFTGLTKEMILERFPATEKVIQQKLAEGYNLNQIFSALMKSKLLGITLDEAFNSLFPTQMNLSSTVTGMVYETVPNLQLANLAILSPDEHSVMSSVYMRAASQLPATYSVTDNVYTSDAMERNLLTSTTIPPVLEKAPVYSKSSFNEAPYSVGNNNEQISSISGNMSLLQSDLSLPGRGGLGFNLERKYDSNSAQYYDMKVRTDSYNYNLYRYYVLFDIERREKLKRYKVKYTIDSYAETDFEADGSIDNVWGVMNPEERIRGTYNTLQEAITEKNRPFNFYVPSDSLEVPDGGSRTNSDKKAFPSTIYYSKNGYSGNLPKKGSADVISGEFIADEFKEKKGTCENKIQGKYNAKGIWEKTKDGEDCPQSLPYDLGGFIGTLFRFGEAETIQGCKSPGTPNWTCTKHFKANYSGTVVKKGSDTRVYIQYYGGRATKPGYNNNTSEYGAWTYLNGDRWRYRYDVSVTPWIEEEFYEGNKAIRTTETEHTTDQNDAEAFKRNAEASVGKLYGYDSRYNYYYANPVNASIQSYAYSYGTGYTYNNETVRPIQETLYPIGKGWGWSLPFIEIADGRKSVHLADGGQYEVEGTKLKGYEWEGISLLSDTTVQVNGESSQYVLTTVDGLMKQYFAGDGRLLRISDAYANSVQFMYTQHPTYGRKLLTQIVDAIGNTININYTETAVTLTKGTEVVTYQKHKDASGIEILDAVIDAQGRRTTYSYQLSSAKTNLMSTFPERAKSNPYALLTSVQHPTGAVTNYQYESSPVTRYLGESSFNEQYRLKERKEQLQYSNGEKRIFNRQTLYYTGDIGQSFGQDHTFQTTIDNGLTQSISSYRKDYIDTTISSRYYLDQQVISAQGLENKTAYTYDKRVSSRNYAASVPTRTVSSNNKTSDTVTTSVQYDDYGNLLEAIDALGSTATYTYDNEKKWLISEQKQVNNSEALHTSYTRNTLGDILQTTTRKNNASGEIVQQYSNDSFDAYGNSTSHSIQNGAKLITTTVEYGAKYNYAFPTKQSVVVTNADNQASTISVFAEYDPSTGLQTASIDGNNNRTNYVYDKLGRMTQATRPDSKLVTISYDDVLNTQTYTDESGIQTRTTWDGLGLKVSEGILKKAEAGSGSGSRYAPKATYYYDAYQRLEWMDDALGNRTRHEYDSWGRETKTTFANGSAMTTAYDDSARRVTQTDAIGNTQAVINDKYGRVVRQEERQSTSGVWIPTLLNVYQPLSGQVIQTTDANNQSTWFEYTSLGELSSVTNAKQEKTSYKYDQLGNMIQVINPDQTTKSKQYDELGRMIASLDETQKKSLYYYDANSNQSKYVDRKGQIFNYTYNNLNQLQAKKGPDEMISFTYEANGSRKSMTDNTGTTQYHYSNDTVELNQVTYPDGKSIAYQYDDRGLRTQMTSPFGIMLLTSMIQ